MKVHLMLAGLICVSAPPLAIGGEPSAQAPSAGPASPGASEYTAHCADCHGAKLEGGVHAPPLVGQKFDEDWRGKRARLLYSRIISTMPQNNPGTLTEQQALAITLYVYALNGVGWNGHVPSVANDLNSLTVPTPSSQDAGSH
jgi:mono/diheme cytochrome c family protein